MRSDDAEANELIGGDTKLHESTIVAGFAIAVTVLALLSSSQALLAPQSQLKTRVAAAPVEDAEPVAPMTTLEAAGSRLTRSSSRAGRAARARVRHAVSTHRPLAYGHAP